MDGVSSSNDQTLVPFPMSPDSGVTWQFVVFDNPHTAIIERNRQRVRSHVMRRYHRQARDSNVRGLRPLRQDEVELDVSPLLQRSVQNTAQAPHIETDDTEGYWPDIAVLSQSFTSNLGPGRLDPFFQYPIRMGRREYELYDHLLDQTCVMFRAMQDIGFFNHIRQSAAFCQLLAMSSWHLAHLNQTGSINEHLGFSLSATQELQKQIDNPLHCSSDDAIGAVLVFACCANLVHDSTAFNAHMCGLQLMLDHRGGLHTLDSNPVLRIMLHWADVNGSYLQDTPPRFPPPTHLLPKSANQDQHLMSPKGSDLSASDEISDVCQAIQILQNLLHTEMCHRNIWQDVIFQGLYIIPILGRVLAMRSKNIDEAGEENTTLGFFRPAAILYISALRTGFGVDTLSGEPLYAAKLQLTLASQSLVGNIPSTMLAWILSIAFTSNCDTERKHWFKEALKNLVVTLEITSFAELKEKIGTVVWDENILVSQSQSLQALFIMDP